MVFYIEKEVINCSCKILESSGIPCWHISHVMKEQLARIPQIFLAQWTKSEKVSTVMKMAIVAPYIDKKMSEIVKFGSLLAACNNLCLVVSKNEQNYTIALEEIQRLKVCFE